jgi:hypothetical protein
MSKYKPITITPREKAEQLIDSVMFSKNQSNDFSDGTMKPIPTNIYYKECALTVVKEILQFMREDDDESETAYWANHPKSNFWVEVEREIKISQLY